MAEKVWFWNLRASMNAPYAKRMAKLLRVAGLADVVADEDLAAIKIHFGEEGTTGFLRPLWMRPIAEGLSAAGAKPFFTDASTLYVGHRGEAVSHAMLAARHGFDPLALGAPVIIADGLKGASQHAVHVGGKHIDEAYIARDIAEADFLVSVNHVKGHELAGFGGAIKNLGMGCASRQGKMHQHVTTGPAANPDDCKGCGECVKICRPGALALDENNRITVNIENCVGCGGCFHACRHGGLVIDWKTDVQHFLERMMEYTLAVLRTKEKPCLHLNYVVDVVPDCDCVGFTDQPLCPDIGVLASWDPVACDQAALDMVAQAQPLWPSKLPELTPPGTNKFVAVHPHVPEDMGLAYAEEIGVGSREYELVKV